MKVPLFDFIQKMSQALSSSVQVLIRENKLDYLKLERTDNPIMARGFQQCLPFSWTTLRCKHCRHPIAVMGVVDTFGHDLIHFSYKPQKSAVGPTGNNKIHSIWRFCYCLHFLICQEKCYLMKKVSLIIVHITDPKVKTRFLLLSRESKILNNSNFKFVAACVYYIYFVLI